MALVDYASSDEEAADAEIDSQRHVRKRARTDHASNLPALPATFLDLYSSTVRTSTQDDPALHNGRKRIVPHIEGNWPTHVFLEWYPHAEDISILTHLVKKADSKHGKTSVHSLLHNELGVSLPLHVSLSRPLVLKTEQREVFLSDLKAAVVTSRIQSFSVRATELAWHPNEDQSRYFLVLRLSPPAKDELHDLLDLCNNVAASYDQPLLYTQKQLVDKQARSQDTVGRDRFHVSIAWSLGGPRDDGQTTGTTSDAEPNTHGNHIAKLKEISFADIKVRIGQTVTSIPLDREVRTKRSLFS